MAGESKRIAINPSTQTEELRLEVIGMDDVRSQGAEKIYREDLNARDEVLVF